MKLENLTIGYVAASRNVVIQKDINVDLQAGELTCLLGPNGAGKTTLLRTLARFIPPLAGRIFINGRDINSLSAAELARQISVVLTEKPSVQSMTVEQLVALGRSPYTGFWGRISNKDMKEVEKALSLTGTETLRSRLVDSLSDGERQKVMIAKAIAQATPVILLDEPTAFLDFPSKAEVMRMLSRIAVESQKTIFLSTHDLNMALAIADRIWLLDKNLGFQQGTPRQLADSGALRNYFSSPDIDFNSHSISFSVSKTSCMQK